MNRITKALTGGAAVAALAVPVGWALGPVSAQPDPTPAPTPSTVSAAPDGASSTARVERRAERRAERQQRLAEELGIGVEELAAARRAVLEDELAARVEAGAITQERADRIAEAAANGTLDDLRTAWRERRATRR